MAADRSRPVAALALGSLLTALAWLMLWLSAVTPVMRIMLMIVSSYCVILAFFEINLRGAFLVYLATFALTVLVPGLLHALLFAALFGLYPLITVLLFDRVSRLWATLISHLTVTLTTMPILYLFNIVFLRWPIWHRLGNWQIAALVLVLQLALFLYDHVLSLLTRLYFQRIRKMRR